MDGGNTLLHTNHHTTGRWCGRVGCNQREAWMTLGARFSRAQARSREHSCALNRTRQATVAPRR
jgi:hypothetical protein